MYNLLIEKLSMCGSNIEVGKLNDFDVMFWILVTFSLPKLQLNIFAYILNGCLLNLLIILQMSIYYICLYEIYKETNGFLYVSVNKTLRMYRVTEDV
jgi:hypothetical protein